MPVIDQQASIALMETYAAFGGNFIDTADIYSSGQSEEVVGAWLQTKKRSDFVIATKGAIFSHASPTFDSTRVLQLVFEPATVKTH